MKLKLRIMILGAMDYSNILTICWVPSTIRIRMKLFNLEKVQKRDVLYWLGCVNENDIKVLRQSCHWVYWVYLRERFVCNCNTFLNNRFIFCKVVKWCNCKVETKCSTIMLDLEFQDFEWFQFIINFKWIYCVEREIF